MAGRTGSYRLAALTPLVSVCPDSTANVLEMLASSKAVELTGVSASELSSAWGTLAMALASRNWYRVFEFKSGVLSAGCEHVLESTMYGWGHTSAGLSNCCVCGGWGDTLASTINGRGHTSSGLGRCLVCASINFTSENLDPACNNSTLQS